MKKIVCLIASLAFVACMVTSCDNTCTCRTYDASGNLITETSHDLEEGQSCDDIVINTFVGSFECR